MAADEDILARINADVEEEHRLREGTDATHPMSAEDRDRLTGLETHLDQLWDLLRQRRARREAGEDPAETAERPPAVVESYLE